MMVLAITLLGFLTPALPAAPIFVLNFAGFAIQPLPLVMVGIL